MLKWIIYGIMYFMILLRETSTSLNYVSMHNMIIEDEIETYRSIIDFNMMSIPEVDIIVDKIDNFNSSLLVINKLKIKKLIIQFEMH